MPSIKQLRYLAAIADHLNFRRAAESCNVSQPTLSGQLQELEQRLGVKLVERSRSRVMMTDVGGQVVAIARNVLRDIEDIRELARQGSKWEESMIRLGSLPTIGPYLLPLVVPELHGRYPKLKLYVRDGRADDLVAQLEQGRMDALILPLPLTATGIETAELYEEPLKIAMPRDHPLASAERVNRKLMKGETVLGLERGHRLQEQVRDICDAVGAELSLDYEGTSLDALRHMVGMGMGLALMPALYVRSEFQADGAVIARRLDGIAPTRTCALVWRARSPHRRHFLGLAEIIRQVAAEGAPELRVRGGRRT